MSRLLIGWLAIGWCAPALAWSPGDVRPIVGVPPSVALVAVPGGVAGTGPNGTWIARNGQVKVTDRGGVALAMGADALWVCGPDGLWRLGLDGALDERSDDPCSAVGWAESDAGPGLLVAGERLAWWPEGAAAKPVPGAGPHRIVGDGQRVAWASGDSARVSWRGALGDGELAAGGPVEALGLGEGTLGWVAGGRLRDATGWSVELSGPVAGLVGFAPAPGKIGWMLSGADGAAWFARDAAAWTPLTSVPAGAPAVIAMLDADRGPDLVWGGDAPAFQLGQCGGAARAAAAVGEPTVVVGRPEPMVQVHVGEPLVVRLSEPGGRPARWEARSSLVGLQVSQEGLLTFTPSAGQVGRHRVSLRIDGSPAFLASGAVWVVVNPARVPPPPVGAVDTSAEPAPVRLADRTRSCGAGVGLAGGLANGADSWETIGQEYQTSLSFGVAVHCGGGEKLRWFAGWDSAPLVRYARPNGISGLHLLGVTLGLGFGNERLQASAIGTVGVSLLGAGVRLEWLPFGPPERASGFDLRALGLFPGGPAGEVMLLYTWRVGGE